MVLVVGPHRKAVVVRLIVVECKSVVSIMSGFALHSLILIVGIPGRPSSRVGQKLVPPRSGEGRVDRRLLEMMRSCWRSLLARFTWATEIFSANRFQVGLNDEVFGILLPGDK